MRRKDREMNADFALKITDKCEWATLATVCDGKPYCVPLTIVRIDDFVYFHTAKEGQKIDCLKSCADVCLCCVGDTNRLDSEFSTEYESAIIYGKASEVTDGQEKITALKALCQRHTPKNMPNFDDAIKQSLSRTGVWKISIDEIYGKRKKYDKDGKEMKFGRME